MKETAVSIAIIILTLSGIAQAERIDLRGQPTAKDVANYLNRFAQGNEGKGGLKELYFDTSTGEVVGKAYIRHKHVHRYVIKDFLGNKYPQHQTYYDWTWNGSFEFNARTRKGTGEIDVGRGFKIDTKNIERILEGDIKGLLRQFPNAGITRKTFRDDYAKIRESYYQKYGRDNVYFVSKNFVDWAAPETVGDWVITGIVGGGGAAAEQAMRQCRRKAQEESAPIFNWLQHKGVGEAQNTLMALLSGQRVDWPYMAVKWQTVGYHSKNWIGSQQVGPEIRSTHAAFVLIWKGNHQNHAGPVQFGGMLNSGSPEMAWRLKDHTGVFALLYRQGDTGILFAVVNGQLVLSNEARITRSNTQGVEFTGRNGSFWVPLHGGPINVAGNNGHAIRLTQNEIGMVKRGHIPGRIR